MRTEVLQPCYHQYLKLYKLYRTAQSTKKITFRQRGVTLQLCIVQRGIVWYCTVLNGIVWYCIAL